MNYESVIHYECIDIIHKERRVMWIKRENGIAITKMSQFHAYCLLDQWIAILLGLCGQVFDNPLY